MGFARIYLTNKGSTLQAKTVAGIPLEITRAAIGNGVLEPYQIIDIPAMTEIVSKIKDVPITEVLKEDLQAKIQLQITNEGITMAVKWREIAIYANDPDEGEILYLYGYAGDDADTIQPPDIEPVEFIFNVICKVFSETEITVNIESSIVYASKNDIDLVRRLLQVSVNLSGWSSVPNENGIYNNKVTVAGIVETENPMAFPIFSVLQTKEEMDAYRKNYGKIVGAETMEGSVEFYAYEKPDADTIVLLKGV